MRRFQNSIIRAVALPALFSVGAATASAQDLVLQKGFSERIEIPGRIKNVAVGDPEIFDAQPLTSNAYLLNAKKEGTTNLLGIDDLGNVVYRARLHVTPVDFWPAFPMRVNYGTKMVRLYGCTPEGGCPAQPTTEVELPPPPPGPSTVINMNVSPQQTTNVPVAPAAPVPVRGYRRGF